MWKRTGNVVEESSWSVSQHVICGRSLTCAVPAGTHDQLVNFLGVSTCVWPWVSLEGVRRDGEVGLWTLQLHRKNHRICTFALHVVRTGGNHSDFIPLSHELEEKRRRVIKYRMNIVPVHVLHIDKSFPLEFREITKKKKKKDAS